MQTKRIFPAVLAAAALIVAMLAVPARRAASPVPVILITVDTLRADHLGLYGYGRPTSPNLDAFARDAIVFENAITPRSKTTPAVASMLTGLLPHRHGVRTLYQPLERGPATLAEILSDAGYETAAFVSNFVLRKEFSGLDRGFDLYDDRLPTREPRRPIYERVARDTCEAVRRWLPGGRGDRFFLWLHLMDPHGPYRPPERFFEATRDDPVPEEAIPDYQRLGTLNREEYVAAYDGEIRCADRELGALLDALRTSGILDRSLVVFTADHGESLGEHGEHFEHGANAYEPCARIPLVIRPPGGVPGGLRVRDPASLVDLAPTVLAAIGLATDLDFDGQPLLDRAWKPVPSSACRLHEKENELRAVRTADRKVVATLSRGRVVRIERYDLRRDPEERRSLGDPDASWRPLEAVLERYVAESVDPTLNLAEIVRRGRERLGPDAVASLRALGYLGR